MAKVSQMQRNRGLESVEDRLKKRLKEGCDPYEALQLYKTAFARFKRLNKLDEGMTFIVNGSIAFSQQNELKSAEDLANLLIATLEDMQEGKKNDLEDHHMDLILKVADAMPMSLAKANILQKAVSLAGKSQTCSSLPKFKDVRLGLAMALSNVGEKGLAVRHYAAIVTTEYIDGFVELIKDWSDEGYPSEKDLFACRAAMHLLSFNKVNEALLFWKAIVPGLPYSPLVVFTFALVELAAAVPKHATKESTNAFKNLQDRYSNAIARDEGLKQLLTSIGEAYFGVPGQKEDDFMGSLMKMLL